MTVRVKRQGRPAALVFLHTSPSLSQRTDATTGTGGDKGKILISPVVRRKPAGCFQAIHLGFQVSILLALSGLFSPVSVVDTPLSPHSPVHISATEIATMASVNAAAAPTPLPSETFPYQARSFDLDIVCMVT